MKLSGGTVVLCGMSAVSAAQDSEFSVTGYRLYSLDGANKVASAEWIEADDDNAAIEVAKTMMEGHDCELWSRSRMIARLPRKTAD